MFGRRDWAVVLVALAGCAEAETLELPPTPEGASSLLLVSRGHPSATSPELDLGVFAFDRDRNGALESSPVVARFVDHWYAIYLARPLIQYGLRPGLVLLAPIGDPYQPLPEAVRVLERAQNGEWLPVELPPEIAELRFADLNDSECAAVSGCRGPGKDSRACAVPCPCVTEPPTARPIAIQTGCALPTMCRSDERWQLEASSPSLGSTLSDGRPLHEQIGSVAKEGAERWLYFASDRLDRGLDQWTRLYKIRLNGDGSQDWTTTQEVRVTPLREERIFLQYPGVRADGLEMTFEGAVDGDYQDRELYISTRAGVNDDWSFGEVIVNLDRLTETVRWPLLLADHRTLLYLGEHFESSVARRESVTAGDTSFYSAPNLNGISDAPDRLLSAAGSCDGGHVYFWTFNEARTEHSLWISKIQGLDPLGFGPKMPVRDPSGAQIVIATQGELFLTESLDCEQLYVSSDYSQRRYRRTTATVTECPPASE